MQAMLRQWRALSITGILFAVSMTGMYFFWYTKMPPADNKKAVS
jgi:hypothetical protein